MKGLCAFVLFISVATGLIAQEQERGISVELNSGLELGWWIWNQGSDNPDIYNNQGWGRSHLSAMYPVGATVFYHHGRGLMGAGFRRSWLFDNVLIDSEEKIVKERYPIAENTVKFWRAGLYGGYKMVQLKRYCFYPRAGLGWFNMNTDFEFQDRFGGHLWWSLSLEHAIKWGQWAMLFSFEYLNMHIWVPDTAERYHEGHRINVVGLNVGLRYTWSL